MCIYIKKNTKTKINIRQKTYYLLHYSVTFSPFIRHYYYYTLTTKHHIYNIKLQKNRKYVLCESVGNRYIFCRVNIRLMVIVI